jgi:hypothetical protein
MSDDSSRNFSSKLAVSSVAIAILSLIVSIGAVSMNFVMDRQERTERLIVDSRPVLEEVRKTNVDLGEAGIVVGVPWEITVRNIGLRDTSIVGYEVMSRNVQGLIDYSGLDGGAYDANGLRLEFPFDLPANGTVRFLQYVGVLASAEAKQVLARADSDIVPWQWLTVQLGREGIDLFANPVTLNEFPGGGYSLSHEQEVSTFQTIVFQLETVQGQVVSTVACTPPMISTC